MTVVLIVLLGLMLLKALWNLGVPYALRGRSEQQGVSLMPVVDLGLWIVACIASWIGDGDSWWQRPLYVGLFGPILFVLSLAHFFIAGAVLGRGRSKSEHDEP